MKIEQDRKVESLSIDKNTMDKVRKTIFGNKELYQSSALATYLLSFYKSLTFLKAYYISIDFNFSLRKKLKGNLIQYLGLGLRNYLLRPTDRAIIE